MPFFSVIIPTYNRSKEIVKALDSVVCQTFNDFEIIVIDDFSTDDTELTIKELNIPNLIFIKNQRKKGACGARNTGCDIANGEWLAFLDSDDLWENNKLEVFYNSISKGQFKVYYSGYHKIVGTTRVDVLDGFSGDHLEKLYFKNIVKGFSIFVVEKDLFWNVGGLDESFLSKQDLDLYIRLAKKAPFGYLKTPLVYINLTSRNRISDNKIKRLKGLAEFYKKYSNEMPLKARLLYSKIGFKLAFKTINIKLTYKFILIYIRIIINIVISG
jgi:glycosyltransferase involved in cell wall biosynthesis